jgi:hypothetical protein
MGGFTHIYSRVGHNPRRTSVHKHNDWGDLPDPPEDNSICVDQGLTDTGDEIFFDREQETDRLCRSVEFEIEETERGREMNNLSVKQRKQKATKLRPNFGWLSAKRILRTLAVTTQFFRASSRPPMRKYFKTRFPAANVNRLDETVATDTYFADTPTHDDGIMGHGGATMVQLCVGKTSHFTSVFPMPLESQMAETLEDYIRQVGAPNVLFSDPDWCEGPKHPSPLHHRRTTIRAAPPAPELRGTTHPRSLSPHQCNHGSHWNSGPALVAYYFLCDLPFKSHGD